MVGLRDLAKLTALLTRASRVPASPRPDSRVVEQSDLRTPAGVAYDLFEPRSASEAVVVPIHGCSLNGKDDPRLQHFGRCLALAGATCALPTLAGLADLRWRESDPDALVDLIRCLVERTQRPVGLIGFSFAGSYALLAAARPRIADRVRFVLAVGAYHSFPELYDHFLTAKDSEPNDQPGWDDRIYLHLTIAYRQRERLRLPTELRTQVVSLLKRYCNQASASEKRSFFEKHLRGLDLVPMDHQHRDTAALGRLSPKGQLASLRCQVGLIHDPADGIVPASQAERLFAELQALPDGDRHRLLVTSLIRHVNLSAALNLPDVFRLLTVLAPLVRG